MELAPSHPNQYVVNDGDTLWDISSMFLRDPWFWPEIWHINPQVENPHLIFPGDVLNLVFDGDGRPRLQVTRGRAERRSPQVRVTPLDHAIPTIPYEAVSSFLGRPTVIAKDEIKLPYILTTREGHLVAGAGVPVYVRGTNAPVGTRYNVIHVGDAIVDPDDNRVIGYQGIHVGEGRIDRAGDPSTMMLTDTKREALEGDRLVPEPTEFPLNFIPRAPEQFVEGRIIAVVDGVARIGQYQVVILNRGSRHGLDSGHVLQIYQTGEVVRDRVGGRGMLGERVKLPDEPAGTVMVFQTYDDMSYGLIMVATSEIRVLDTVRNPS